MKSLIMIGIWVATLGSLTAQTAGYQALTGDKQAYYKNNFVKNKKAYIGRSVTDLLNDLEVPVGSFILMPNYNNPEYGNEFRFSNLNINATSTIIHSNSGTGLYMLYVRFSPQIKYPTTGFIKENKEKALTREQYKEFAKYQITDIEVSIFPR